MKMISSIISNFKRLFSFQLIIVLLIVFIITYLSLTIELDQNIHLFVEDLPKACASALSIPFNPVIQLLIITIIGLTFYNNRNRERGYELISVILISLAINGIIKVLTARIGPQVYFESLMTNIFDSFTFNPPEVGCFNGIFPSGHAMLSSAIATSIIIFATNRFVKGFILLWIIAANVSVFAGDLRNYHWFTDVLAGSILGVFISMKVHQIVLNRNTKLNNQKTEL